MDQSLRGPTAALNLPHMRAKYRLGNLAPNGGGPISYGYPLIMLFFVEREPVIFELDSSGQLFEPAKKAGFIGFDGAWG